MSYSITSLFILFLGLLSCASSKAPGNDGWISLFDGKSLSGWKVGENPETFTIDSGRIKVHGKRAHLFYSGNLSDTGFTDFHFKTEVMTTPGSNSGIYFHAQYQEKGWPSTGFEVQVNNSHTDWRRSGSLYAINDVRETFVKDNEWYTQEIIVLGKSVTVKLNGNTVMQYTESENIEGKKKLSNGTFALQGHDPMSKVYYRNIQVKLLK
jgi:hypothetical protein